MKKIVILGAGTAGTIMLNKLHRKYIAGKSNPEIELTIIDKDNVHYYQPGFLFIPFGMYNPNEVKRSKEEFFPKDIHAVFDEVVAVDKLQNVVKTLSGQEIAYDILIVATGTDIVPSETQGLLGELWYKKIFDFYTFDGSVALSKAMQEFKGGNLVVHINEMPIKCPVAPLEFIFLADSYFKNKGMRDKVTLTYVTPLDGAFTKPTAKAVLGKMLIEKNIHVVADFNAELIDNETCEIVGYDQRKVPFDLMVSIPTNMGARFLEESDLGDDLNYIATNKHTLQSNEMDNIFVIGDATDVPASKAGSVAHFESEILMENLAAFLEGKPFPASFDGHANCFVESGDGKALLIDFNYEVEPLQGHFPLPVIGPMALLKESHLNHIGKLMFKWVYWNMLLRGLPIPLGPEMSMRGKKTQTSLGETYGK